MLVLDEDLLKNMAQLALFQNEISLNVSDKTLLKRATGRFYTHELIATHLVEAILRSAGLRRLKSIDVIEPFCGDGRLVCKLLEYAAKQQSLRRLIWSIELWDNDLSALESAQQNVQRIGTELNIETRVKGVAGNAFLLAPKHFGRFTICITNPPWEVLKPDRRELINLDEAEIAQYVRLLREQDVVLTHLYPLSRPSRKF